jgi:teichuronic acid biosynthesis glycosyltransferase TuaG
VKVSVITPMYNAARFISETINSALQQTEGDLEVLAVDDCSRDDTWDVVQRIAAQDSRVRPLRHAKNGGPAAARNTALEAARGRDIAFLDSDDLWMPDKIEAQLQSLAESSAVMSYTAYRRISGDGTLISPVIAVPPQLDYSGSSRNTAMMTSTVVVDTSRTGTFRMKLLYYDDYACWLELLGRGGFALAVPRDLMRYRVLAGSVSRNKFRSAAKVWDVYRRGERLSLPKAAWCFAGYAWHATKKYFFV